MHQERLYYDESNLEQTTTYILRHGADELRKYIGTKAYYLSFPIPLFKTLPLASIAQGAVGAATANPAPAGEQFIGDLPSGQYRWSSKIP